MNYDNPAARLLALLDEGKKKPPTSLCRVVWDEILQCQGDASILMSRLGKVMELPSQTVLALRESAHDQAEIWNHWESQVYTAFANQNLSSHWSTFINHIDAHTINYLKMSAMLLDLNSNTKLMADEQLIEIREKLNALLSEVIASDTAHEVKLFLTRHLRKLITSIDEYYLTGALPLLEAVETSVGHAYLEPKYKSFLTDTDLGKRILDTLGSMANVVTVAVGIPQLNQTLALLANQAM